jgi:subtilase family serine protease/Tol biopolymer transport system component/flagellar hook assembly protein FlgD
MRCTRYASAIRVAIAAAAVLSLPFATSAQGTSQVAVLHADPASFDAGGWGARAAAGRSFYANHQDAYDFLVLFPVLPIDLTSRDPGETLGKHWFVRNDVSGIGLQSFDGGVQFGSPSRLKGVVDIHSLVPGSGADSVDVALSVIAHEVAHQWSSYVSFRDPRTGAKSTALIGRDGAHWSYFLDSDASVMYGSDWRDLGNGQWVADASRKRYSPLDLYLLGILDASEVPGFSLLVPGPNAPTDPTALPPSDGTTIQASAVAVSVANVIAAEGERVPGAATSQKAFRAAFALVVPEGVDATPDQIAFAEEVRREWENRFFFLTRGRAVMETTLVEVAPGSLSSSPGVASGIGYLVSVQQPDGAWRSAVGLEERETQAALEALAGFRDDARTGISVAAGAGYLVTSVHQSADSCARAQLGIRIASGAASVAAAACFDAHWIAPDGGIAPSTGYRSTIVDTVLTGVALSDTDMGSDLAHEIIAYLLANQNSDGGWPFLPGGPSQVEPTAWVLRLLARSALNSPGEYAAAAGKIFLLARAQPGGGFGDVVAEPAATAEAVLALAAWNALGPGQADLSASYLLGTQQQDGSWFGSIHDTAMAVRVLREVLTPNLAVSSVALQPAATDGELVYATVQILNTGARRIDGTTVQAFDSAGKPFGSAIAVPPLTAGQVVSVSVLLDTTGHAGSTEAFLVVDPDGALAESSKADNRIAVPFVIGAPPALPDLVALAGSLSADPPQIASLPTVVTVRATVANVGRADAAGVLVELRVRGVPAGSLTIDVPARTTVAVQLVANIGPGTGDVPIEMVIDPAGAIAEASKSNNRLTGVIPAVPGVDLRVAGLTLAPSVLDLGSNLQIAYLLSNSGTSNAQVGVEVRIYDETGRKVATVLDPAVGVQAGAVLVRGAVWPATVSGTLRVVVDATYPGDRQPADNITEAYVTVRPSSQPNLAIRMADLVASASPANEGQSTDVSVTVRNVGGGAAGPFALDVWRGTPGAGQRLGRFTSSGLAAGATWTQHISLPISSPSDVIVTAVADADGSVAESDESDNTAVLTVPVRSLPDLVLGSGALVASNAFPRLGETVSVGVTVSNTGGQDSGATDVEFRYAPDGGDEVVVGSRSLASIAGGGSTTVSFGWTAAVAGPGRLVAIVNGSRNAIESSYDNDRTERSVLVQDAAVAVTNPYFSPNGDGVKDDTTLFWRGSADAVVTVDVVSSFTGERVRQLRGTGGSIAWDGRDESGKVARDGEYTLSATAGTSAFGRAKTVVDTNRSPIQEASGATLQVDDLRRSDCNGVIAVAPTVRLLPDDTGLVYYGWGPQGSAMQGFSNMVGNVVVRTCYGGIFLKRFDDSPPTYLGNSTKGEQLRFALSPDGASLAFLDTVVCKDPKCGGAGSIQMHLISVLSGEDQVVWQETNLSQYPASVAPVFSPDGRRIAFMLEGYYYQDGYSGTTRTIESIGIDGMEHRVVASMAEFPDPSPWLSGPGFWPAEIAYSPDGKWVSFVYGASNLALASDAGAAPIDLFRSPIQPTQPDWVNWVGGGPDRHSWMANGHEIAFVRPDGIFAIDVSTSAERLLVDPASLGEIDPLLARDGRLAVDSLGRALALPTSPAGEARLNFRGRYRIMMSAPPGALPYTFWETPEAWSEVNQFAWSPSGSLMSVQQPSQGGGDEHTWVVQSLANLPTRIAAIADPSAGHVTFRGTATDLHFDRYEIRARLLQDSAASQTVATSSSPVVDDVLATWTPPAQGLYEATLTAFDKAGNARERRTRFTWGEVVPVANLQRAPEFISPNGDGVQDATILSFSVVTPATLTFTVSDDAGRVVRTLQRSYTEPQDSSITWDGSGEDGAIAADGTYWMSVEGQRFRVVVDTTRPSIRFALLDDLPPKDVPPPWPSLSPLAQVEWTARSAASPCASVQQSEQVSVPTVRANATWEVQDANDVDWRLEVVSQDGIQTLRQDQTKALQHQQFALSDVAGRKVRVVAVDRAGNRATSDDESYSPGLFLLGYGSEQQASYCIPGRGLLQVGYPDTFQIYPAGFADISRFHSSPLFPLDIQPGERALLVFASTSSSPLASLAVAYRHAPDDPFTYDRSVQAVDADALLWDLGQVGGGAVEFFVEATDIYGNVFTSETEVLPISGGTTGSRACLDDAALETVPQDGYATRMDHLRFELDARVGHRILPPSAALEFRRKVDVGYGPVDKVFSGSELVWSGAEPPVLWVDVSAVPGCAYNLTFHGFWDDGVPYATTDTIDLCGAFIASYAKFGTQASVSIGETFRQPISGATVRLVYTPDPSAIDSVASPTEVGAFEGRSAPVTIDLSHVPACSLFQIGVAPHFPDGTSPVTSSAFRGCRDRKAGWAPCTTVDVGHWVRTDGPVCSGLPSTFQVPIVASSRRTIASLDAQLLSVDGTRVLPLDLPGITLGTSVMVNVPIPSDLPDGTYLVKARARDSGGDEAQDVSTSAEAIVIERAPPIVTLAAPTSNAVVCASPSGGTWGVDVQGSASDANLDSAALLIQKPGASAFAPVPLQIPRGATAISGMIGRVTTVTGGEYAVRIAARDASGNETCSPPRTFHVASAPAITDVRAEPAAFAPGSVELGTSSLTFDLAESAAVRFSTALPDGSSATIGQLSAGVGTNAFSWNGSAVGTGPLPDGRYAVVLDATGACGQSSSATISVELDTQPPVVEVSSPVAGSQISSDLLVTGSIHDANLQGWEVSFGSGSAEFDQVASGTESSWGVLGIVPTGALAAGNYVIRVRAWDSVQHETTVDVPVTVAPSVVLDRFVVSPAIVSPNGDGLFDTATANLTLKTPAVVSMDVLDPAGQLATRVLSGSSLSAGASSTPLASALAGIAQDGDYSVVVTAVGTGVTEQARATLTVDRTKPTIALSAPGAGACVAGPFEVRGTVADAHLKRWTVTAQTSGQPDVTLGSGSSPIDGVLASTSGLPEGAHQIVVTAEDVVGNSGTGVTALVVDRTAPEIALTAPVDGAWLTKLQGPIVLQLDAHDANLTNWMIRVDRGGSSEPIASGTSSGTSYVSWDANMEPDGAATLVAEARDCAGARTTTAARVTFDGTLPQAKLDAPRDSFVKAPLVFSGTASDANLESWRIELASGPASTALAWAVLATGTSSVVSGPIAELVSLPSDGVYTVRLVVRDRAGNEATDTASFVVDTTPPRSPVLQAAIRKPSDAVLTWTASPDPDVVGYRVLRAAGTDALAVRTAALVSGPGFEDLGLPDGTWRYALVAVNAAGLESAPSNEVALVVDSTPPLVMITSPRAGALASGTIDLVGTAFAQDDFKEYRVSIGSGPAPSSFSLIRRSSLPVRNAVLASLDTSLLAQGSIQTVRLEGEDLAGNVAEARVTIQIDNQPPAAPVLLSATAVSRFVTLTWAAGADADLAGYVIYRNGVPLNVPASALADPRPYLVGASMTSYFDQDVPDGTFVYRLQAYDLAGNPSALSNAQSVTIDLRPPSATIVAPGPLARVGGVFDVVADCADLDLATVQLEVRAGTGPFVPLGPALTTPPWVARLDPSLLASPVLELRAIATDLGGRTDPSPGSVFAFFDPALDAPEVVARTDAQAVTIQWTDPNASGRVAGFRVRADGASLVQAPIRPTGTATASVAAPYPASYAYDGSGYTRWYAGVGSPQWWQLDLAKPSLMDRIDITSGSYGAGFDLSLRIRGTWVPFARGLTLPGSVVLSPSLQIEGVRIDLAPSPYNIDIVDVTLTPSVVATTTTTSQSNIALGAHAYEVDAVSPFGSSATGTASANVYQPVLAALPAAVPATPIALTGSGATAGADVAISSSGSVVAHAAAGDDGVFTASVPVLPGQNTFTAQAVDADGNRSVPSAPVSTLLDPPPSAGVALTLAGIDRSNVSLTFVPSDITSIVSFAVRRDDGGGFRTVATLNSSARAAVDSDVANGSHRYRVVALNARGFEGPPSNEVTAVVSAPLPAAPLLAASTPPSGGSVQLDWTYGGAGPVAFAIERLSSASNAFARIVDRMAGTTYVDFDVVNGLAYQYRVVAIDLLGNEGTASNVAVAVPTDGTASSAPHILAPTVPGAPISVAERAAVVAGAAELGATVELFQNARSLGTTIADQFAVAPSSLALGHVPTSALDAPSGAGRIAYTFTDSTGQPGVAVEDLASGERIDVAIPSGVSVAAGPWLSPRGDRAAFVGAVGLRRNIYVLDTVAGVPSIVDLDPTRAASSPAWSPDGRQLAYVEKDASSHFAVVVGDGTAGGSRACAGQSFDQLRWTSSSEVAGIERVPSGALVACDVVAGSVRTVLRAADPRTWAVGAGGIAAVIVRESSGLWLDVVSADASVRRFGSAVESTPVFSPDRARVSWIDGAGTLQVATVTSGIVRSAAYSPSSGFLGWPLEGMLVRSVPSGAEPPSKLQAYGRFELPVALDVGDNVFAAKATDAAGRQSDLSASILVRLETGTLPDLSVTAQLQPPAPLATAPANALVVVRNIGGGASPATVLEGWISGFTGTRTAPSVSLPSLAPGAEISAALPLDLTGLSGPYILTAIVDSGQAMADVDRTNNRADVPFVISAGGEAQVAVSVTSASVPCDGAVVAQVMVANPGASRNVALRISLEDAAGNPAITLPAMTLSLPGGGTYATTVQVPVGLTLAGDYQLVASIEDGGGMIASGTAAVTIEAEIAVAVAVSSARASYLAGEQIELDAVVSNASRNAPLGGASVQVEIADAAGTVVASQGPLPLPDLWIGGAQPLAVSLGTLSAGTYVASVNVVRDGVPVASGHVTFAVASEPLLAGLVSVSGTEDPPAVKTGAAIVSATLQNVGTGPAYGAQAAVVVVSPDGTELTRADLSMGDLVPGQTQVQQTTVDVRGLPLGTYGIVLVASYDGRIETLATTRFRIADGLPPMLAVIAPLDGSFVRGSISLNVHASDDASGTASVQVSVDGGPAIALALASGVPIDGIWSGPIALGADGPHTVVITATDVEGNGGFTSPTATNPIVLRVVSDTIRPVISIGNVAESTCYAAPVTPLVNATDANLAVVDARLDGAPFQVGATVSEDGDHTLVAQATDRAANQASAQVRFVVDQTPPRIGISGTGEGTFVSTDVQWSVVVQEAHLTSLSVTANGNVSASSGTASVEGPYTVAAHAADCAGNTADAALHFTIDKTPPAVSIDGVADGAHYASAVVPSWSASDANLASVVATLNGIAIASGTTVSANGNYLLEVTAVDLAGNRTVRDAAFTIDQTPLTVTVSGFVDGSYVNTTAVYPSYEVTSSNLDHVDGTVDGMPFVAGLGVTVEGFHVFSVTAYEQSGNQLNRTGTFTIDRTPPAVTISGVAEGAFVSSVVSLTFAATDANFASSVATLDGEPFTLGTTVVAEGPHAVDVVALDLAGNRAEVRRSFVIDLTAPVVVLSGFTPGEYVAVDVQPDYAVTDANLGQVTATLDGAPFVRGTVVTSEAAHVFDVVATDRAGNRSEATGTFTIDRTPPSITISGIAGACVATNVTPVIEVTDANLDSWSAALNGAPFQSGTVVTAERAYTISAIARDKAGSSTTAQKSFTIDKTAPSIDVVGIRDGAYVGRVAPIVTFTDANLVGSELTLDGAPFVSGTTVAGEGVHFLHAAAWDCAGHTAKVDETFTVDTTPPTIAVAGVVEGEVTNRDVTPLVNVHDVNLAGFQIRMDGADFSLGGVVPSEGSHLLEIVANDLAGNVASTSIRFEIDKLPPVLWASIVDGVTYAEPVTIGFGATDRNLADVTATMDGVSVTSGSRVDSDGPHVLTVRATDLAGNAATRSWRFEIRRNLDVRYTVAKRLLDRHARVLALLPCPSAAADRMEAFVRGALPNVPVTVVRTVLDLLVQLRNGIADVVVIGGDGSPTERSCAPTSSPLPLGSSELAQRAEQELTEAAFRGAGIVVFRDGQAAWPQLVEALGLTFQGNEAAGLVAIAPSSASESMRLSIVDGVQLKLGAAAAIGRFELDHGPAAAVHSFGMGAAATFGFDPSVSTSTADAARLLAGAVAYVAPESAPTPRGVVAVGIDVWSVDTTSTHVTESVDSALQIVGVSAGGQQPAPGTIEWRFDPDAGATTSLSYLVRLPAVAGTFHTSTTLASITSSGESVYGTTYPLDIVLARGEAAIASSAQALAGAIPAVGSDATRRKRILAALSSVASNPGATAADRETAIGALLVAIDNVKALRTVDPTPLRLEVDALLATWEARQ